MASVSFCRETTYSIQKYMPYPYQLMQHQVNNRVFYMKFQSPVFEDYIIFKTR